MSILSVLHRQKHRIVLMALYCMRVLVCPCWHRSVWILIIVLISYKHNATAQFSRVLSVLFSSKFYFIFYIVFFNYPRDTLVSVHVSCTFTCTFSCMWVCYCTWLVYRTHDGNIETGQVPRGTEHKIKHTPHISTTHGSHTVIIQWVNTEHS